VRDLWLATYGSSTIVGRDEVSLDEVERIVI
jgi:hypothetical protein